MRTEHLGSLSLSILLLTSLIASLISITIFSVGAVDAGSVTIETVGEWENLTDAPEPVGYYNGHRIEAMGNYVYFWAANSTGFYRYNTSTSSWETLDLAPTISSYGIGIVRAKDTAGNPSIYIMAGSTSANSQKWYRYTDAGGWSGILNTSIPWSGSGAQKSCNKPANGSEFVWDGEDIIYYFPGSGYSYDRYDWYKYTISSNNWTYMGEFNTSGGNPKNGPGNSACLVTLGSEKYIYIQFGNTPSGNYTDAEFWRYQISNGQWTKMAQTGHGADDGADLVWNGGDYIYFSPGAYIESSAGGCNEYEFWRYSISGNTWVTLTEQPYNGSNNGNDDAGASGLVGEYIYRLKGGDGNGSSYASNFYRYQIETIPSPTRPVLISPENNTSTFDNTPTFIWTRGSNADSHRIEVDNDKTFSPPLIDNVVVASPNDNTWAKPSQGYASGIYYWRVWAKNAQGENVSDTWQFIVAVHGGSPIHIVGNANFTPANGVNGGGSGTAEDPYIIENWEISAATAHGITIEGTTAYFVVRNCVVENGGTTNSGIYLKNVVNGRIENNTCENNNYGMNVTYSSNNSLTNNTCANNYSTGINFSGSSLSGSSNNILKNNTCKNNYYGIFLRGYSSINTLEKNTFENSDYGCIFMNNSSNNILNNNTFRNNSQYGIYLYRTADNNCIYHNNFINNATQASDGGSNYWDNGYSPPDNYPDETSGGNYWSDYTGVDLYHGENQDIHGSDGIGDTPYSILGGSNQDRYPLTGSPVCDVEVIIENELLEGRPCEWLEYTISVHNSGNIVDNFILSYIPDGWPDITIVPENLIDVAPGENRQAKLYVHVPDGAEPCTYKEITVTAESEFCHATDSDSAQAHVAEVQGMAVFSFVNLYTVNVEKILDINSGSKLVVKFYTYDNTTYEGENVIETFVPPVHVEENEHARHPGGTGVKNARLDLTTDDTENVISTIASFTVCRLDLAIRFSEIPAEWLLAQTPEAKLALAIEFSEVPAYWLLAPD